MLNCNHLTLKKGVNFINFFCVKKNKKYKISCNSGNVETIFKNQ